MKKTKKTTIETISKKDNMENIAFLTSTVQQLNGSFGWWHSFSNWLVLVVVFAIACLYFAQYITAKKAILKDTAKDELAQAIDKKQALQIAKANAEAAKATEKAESELLERTRLEAELAPRKLEQKQSAIELSTVPSVSVVIESIAESEPWRTAGQIAYTLDKAKWNVLPGMKRFLDTTHFFDGVAVETNVGARPKSDHSVAAADALVDVFKKNGIESHRRPSLDNLPANTIKIRVGLKPAEYFDRNRSDLEYGNMLYK